jgi:hypothetical protein
VDVRDVIEAAVACDTCRNIHAPALTNGYVPDPPRDVIWPSPTLDEE